jgi:hypothetical protein
MAMAALLTTPACGMHALPSGSSGDAPGLSQTQPFARPVDTTSILKKLTKDVEIGSTVDTRNGDKGPRSLYIAHCDCKGGRLGQNQLVVCNFDNKGGTAGDGTTIEALDPTPKAKPLRFAQSDSIKGCDGAAVTSINAVYGTGLTSGKIVQFSNNGTVVASTKTLAAPFSDADALPRQFFSPEYIFVGSMSGGIINLSVGFHGTGKTVRVVNGFAVQTGSKGTLAPSGLQYNRAIDTLYVVDGASNTVVALSHASELLDKDEISIGATGTTFKCKFPYASCATLVKAGSPLNAPVASTLLPNGNLIVANTEGKANELVELTPTGQILDTEVVDASKTQGIFGLAAAGTNDGNTVVFYTDTNTNTVQELEP